MGATPTQAVSGLKAHKVSRRLVFFMMVWGNIKRVGQCSGQTIGALQGAPVCGADKTSGTDAGQNQNRANHAISNRYDYFFSNKVSPSPKGKASGITRLSAGSAASVSYTHLTLPTSDPE